MAEAGLLAGLELVVRLVLVLVHVLQVVQLQGRWEWMRKIGVDHNIAEHKETIQQCPEGYEENTQYLGLKINIGMGLHHPVKWIKLLDKGTVTGFCDDDGPGSSSHILKIYAQPYLTPEPVEPLPHWFKTILLGLSPMYHNFVQATGELNDWGIKADIQRFYDTDAFLVKANNEDQK